MPLAIDNLTSYHRSCTAKNVAKPLMFVAKSTCPCRSTLTTAVSLQENFARLMSSTTTRVHTHPDDQLEADTPAIPEEVSAQAFPNQAAALPPATPPLLYLTRGSYGAVSTMSTTHVLFPTKCMFNVNGQKLDHGQHLARCNLLESKPSAGTALTTADQWTVVKAHQAEA